MRPAVCSDGAGLMCRQAGTVGRWWWVCRAGSAASWNISTLRTTEHHRRLVARHVHQLRYVAGKGFRAAGTVSSSTSGRARRWAEARWQVGRESAAAPPHKSGAGSKVGGRLPAQRRRGQSPSVGPAREKVGSQAARSLARYLLHVSPAARVTLNMGEPQVVNPIPAGSLGCMGR